jgi:hypothetical protein
MESYKNGDSGITFYEIGEDFIKIWFKDKTEPYTYSNSGINELHINTMKTLAITGKGLATYINQHPEVKNGYDKVGATAPPSNPPPKY